jgi:hypothetical protein
VLVAKRRRECRSLHIESLRKHIEKKKQTLYAPHKDKRYSVTIIRFRGVGSGIVIVSVSVTRDRGRKVLLVGNEEGGDCIRLVPVSASESGSAENFLWLNTMLFEGVAEEHDVFMASLILVLVGLLGFGWQRTWRSARSVRAVRWTSAILVETGDRRRFGCAQK